MDQGEHSRDGELPHSMHVLKADLGRFVDNVIEREREELRMISRFLAHATGMMEL